MSTALPAMVRKRASWLVILFVGEMLTATAMGLFEIADRARRRAGPVRPAHHLQRRQLGLAGRHADHPRLALGEVGLKDWWRVMRRELLAGVLLGCILGSIGFLRIAAWNAFSNIYGPHWFLVGLTVSLSLVGVVVWGTLTGSMLPFLLRRLGFDPATSSAPFVATLVDVTGLIIYFTIAIILLRGTLL